MVKEVAPTAACKGILRPNDVVCQVDGIPVASKLFVENSITSSATSCWICH